MAFSEQEEREASASAVGGMLDAKLYIAAPWVVAGFLSLAIDSVAYLLAVIAICYGLLVPYGERMRRHSALRSQRHSLALWILWPSVCGFLTFGFLAIVLLEV